MFLYQFPTTMKLVALVVMSAVAVVDAQSFLNPTTREVEVFVNVYDHPKTGFSCQGKNPGEYYADPATKCAVYYVCIPNPTGTLSPQSFACPNGTIFSQATRVCRPHEEVYCPLTQRFYDSVHGSIDTKFEAHPLPLQPELPSPPPRRQETEPQLPRRQEQSHRRQEPAPQPQRRPEPVPQALPPPPPPQPAAQPKPSRASNPFNNLRQGFRNSRVFASTSTTTTTTTTSTQAPPPPGLVDYEYDYGDYNDTGLLNAASSNLQQTLASIENVELPIESVESEDKIEQDSSTADEASSSTRVKRQSDQWTMLSRRKGQLSETEKQEVLMSRRASTAFTCEDKVPGVAYADIESNCTQFYVCVTVAKGKLWTYHLNCDQGKHFDQMLGMCAADDEEDAGNSGNRTKCEHSERYYVYNKWYKTSKKHWMQTVNKQKAKSITTTTSSSR